MIPILAMLLNTPAGAILKTFIEDCGFTPEDVSILKYYAETQATKAGANDRHFKPTGNCMYVLTFENGAQHCKYINDEMLAAQKVMP